VSLFSVVSGTDLLVASVEPTLGSSKSALNHVSAGHQGVVTARRGWLMVFRVAPRHWHLALLLDTVTRSLVRAHGHHGGGCSE
jgi:hypothetical protein